MEKRTERRVRGEKRRKLGTGYEREEEETEKISSVEES